MASPGLAVRPQTFGLTPGREPDFTSLEIDKRKEAWHGRVFSGKAAGMHRCAVKKLEDAWPLELQLNQVIGIAGAGIAAI